MSGLVGATFAQAKVAKQWVPDPLGDIVMAQWPSVSVTKDKTHLFAGDLLLLFECIVDLLRHVDGAERAIVFGVDQLSFNKRLAYQDLASIKIDILPLKSINLTGTQACKKPDGIVATKIGSNVR